MTHFFSSPLWLKMKVYFFSIYENTLVDLGIFATGLLLLFLIRNIYMKYHIKTARAGIPMVIGGWGTRGKSSVERLKGALMNAMGYGIISKTTGCEAMFLYGTAYGDMHEMFIFRPYDKATIWEQHNLTKLTYLLRCEVFLWECMGLTPAYVNILQREWMKDDIATITNTYPDHEDLQGPAGIDIPEVMTNFIPENSTLITTEEQMLPILDNAAIPLNTKVKPVTWLEAGLIASDVMERFSYEEHPYNIALVIQMAREMGIDEDFALKEMADRVIPDIGMLKVYPKAYRKKRALEFVSGMSANERFGALSNWKRTGFDTHSLENDPDIWVMTVVNNRADRIPRSRVFAGMLVEDISADRHILIGSNLSGMAGYIKEAWEDWVSDFTLWPASDDEKKKDPETVAKDMATYLRVPFSKEQLKKRVESMLTGTFKGIEIEPMIDLMDHPESLKEKLKSFDDDTICDELIAFYKKDKENFDQFTAFIHRLKKDKPKKELDEQFKRLMKVWYDQKIVVIWDYHASGNQIVKRVVEETPPGLTNRIMMLQNIKGTGLDFVYTFQAWEKCHVACSQLIHEDPFEVEAGLRVLSAFQEYGLLSEEYVKEIVERVKHSEIAQTERFQAELAMILSNLNSVISGLSGDVSSDKTGIPSLKIFDWIEAFQDAQDAVKRRKMANRIYKDLVNERISPMRAAKELQKLNKRQKGGWLFTQVSELYQKHSWFLKKSSDNKRENKN